MFIDSTAVVAIVKSEPEAAGFLAALAAAEGKVFCSPIVRFDATVQLALAIARADARKMISETDQESAEWMVGGLLSEAKAKEIHITESLGRSARAAAGRYGRLSGHPANLTVGDCFTYACAKGYHLPVLYKGNHFSKTDL